MMKCPKCDAKMEPVSLSGVEVDRCVDCKGIFFDAGEHQELKEIKRSDVIDIGNASVGKIMDEKTDVTCPRCGNVKMIEVHDIDQGHIKLDACPECRGVYFDAGEFSDFRSFNFVDYLKGLFSRKKKK